MIDILQLIPHYAKKSPAGWWSFNAPCCTHNGETRDKRKRGGLIVEGQDWAYKCFNCNYKARFVMGQTIGYKARKLLEWMGVDSETIKKMNLESIRNRKFTDVASSREYDHNVLVSKNIHFETHALPGNARPITLNDKKFINYLKGRGLSIADYSFKVTPNAIGRDKNRIMIPYLYHNDIVGWTSRYLDDRKPKYKNENQQLGYVFGIDFQQKDWEHVIVSEGIMNSISIKCLAVMSNEITELQLAIIRRLDKDVIVVPDQDKPGLYLAQEAIDNGFAVSVPDWGKDDNGNWITDINEAVQKYGKLGTLLSIFNAKETNKIRITVALNKMKKRLHIK